MRSTWLGGCPPIIAAGAALLSACWAAEEVCGDEDCALVSLSVLGPCESFGCGGNAQIADYTFHELHTGGSGTTLPNEQGFVLESFKSGEGAAHRLPVETPMSLEVQGDMLFGLVTGQPAVGGQELVGATLNLLAGPELMTIRIQTVSDAEFWVSAAGGPARAPTYQLTHVIGQPNRPWLDSPLFPSLETPICDPWPWPGPVLNLTAGWPGAAQTSDSLAGMAILFAGDRYDRPSVTVEVPGGQGWFNIGCVGTALAKLHLLRHTSAGSGSGTGPSWEQRQAMLKLLTADYCGDGRPSAVNGTPLFFQDQDGRFDPTPWLGDRVAEFEAIWTPAGALCLEDPRRPDPARTPADVRAEIVRACENSPVESRRRTIPRCTSEQLATWPSLGPISRNVDPLW